MHFQNTPIKLIPSNTTGIGTELFIVEGDSAASSVASLRESQFQAVLPLQGKPMNALKATEEKVHQYPLFRALVASLGVGGDSGLDVDSRKHSNASQNAASNAISIEPFNFDKRQYERIICLFDPDADGIHIGALMLMYFYKFMRPMLENGCILMVHPPWMQFIIDQQASPTYTYSEPQSLKLSAELHERKQKFQSTRYRGLAGIDREILIHDCIDPKTRTASIMSVKDAEMAIQVFGGGSELSV